MQEFTIILFILPDGRIVLQRRTKDAPYGAGLLGIWGGRVEKGETADECLVREIKEETSLDTNALSIDFITDLVLPESKDFPGDRRFYLYKAPIKDMDFEIYEGDRAEAFSMAELKKRSDLTGSAKYVVDNIMKGIL